MIQKNFNNLFNNQFLLSTIYIYIYKFVRYLCKFYFPDNMGCVIKIVMQIPF